MKKTLIIIGMAISLLMTACVRDKSALLVGTWEFESVQSDNSIWRLNGGKSLESGWFDVTNAAPYSFGEDFYVFNDDGTYYWIRYSDYYNRDVTRSGEWEIKNDTLRTDGSGYSFENCKIVQMKSGRMVLTETMQDGSHQKIIMKRK